MTDTVHLLTSVVLCCAGMRTGGVHKGPLQLLAASSTVCGPVELVLHNKVNRKCLPAAYLASTWQQCNLCSCCRVARMQFVQLPQVVLCELS